MGITRAHLLKSTGAGALGLVLFGRVPLAFAIPEGATLAASGIPKYRQPLIVPPAMPQAGQPGGSLDLYEIAVRQFGQHILPPELGLQPTTVWSYGSTTAPGTVFDGGSFHYPAFTIEARIGRPARVKWVNDLVDADGRFLPHLLPVDPTLHWANPPGGTAHRDSRPEFLETPGPYTGPVPIVTHVHGAIGVGDESDGYAEAWYLPDATNVPDGFARVGTWYDHFAAKAAQFASWGPGNAVFQYPNGEPGRAAALWYHDHTLGMTRLNVYAGPAGFYLLRGGPSDDVLDSRTGRPAILPGPAPALGDPAGTTYYELPLAIQDRSFAPDGSLFYPDTRAFFDGVEPPYVPETDVPPIWNPEFFGETIVVNGRTWPFHDVERRRYRLRVLNGCNSRFLVLRFDDRRVRTWQIGNEGGFLPAPVNIDDVAGGRVLLAPAERADLIVDFGAVPPGAAVTLLNEGPDEPFGGFPVEAPADPATTGQVLEFRVQHTRGPDRTTHPRFLALPPVPTPSGGTTRQLALLEEMSMHAEDAPVAALLGTVSAGTPESLGWTDEISENPAVGDTEVWELHNLTADAHPIHVHEVAFEVVDREGLVLDEEGEEAVVPLVLSGDRRPPEPWERGVKDTVIAYPGEVTRIRARFDTPGRFVWHCHIVEHEDNEMMRPYRIGPAQPGEPDGHH